LVVGVQDRQAEEAEAPAALISLQVRGFNTSSFALVPRMLPLLLRLRRFR